MSGTSVAFDIQTALVNLLQTHTFDSLAAENIIGRMLPAAGEIIDNIPGILVAPFGEIGWELVGFEVDQSVSRSYLTEVCVVTANNSDFSTNQERYQGWIEKVAKIITPIDFLATNPPIESIWSVTIIRNPSIDRALLSRQYVYQSIVVRCDSQESRN